MLLLLPGCFITCRHAGPLIVARCPWSTWLNGTELRFLTTSTCCTTRRGGAAEGFFGGGFPPTRTPNVREVEQHHHDEALANDTLPGAIREEKHLAIAAKELPTVDGGALPGKADAEALLAIGLEEIPLRNPQCGDEHDGDPQTGHGGIGPPQAPGAPPLHLRGPKCPTDLWPAPTAGIRIFISRFTAAGISEPPPTWRVRTIFFQSGGR